jgi:hypothetical protein
MKIMKLVYIAGPYSASTHLEREQNILQARIAGAQVAKLGAYPLIPHSNTAHIDTPCDDLFWYEGGLELLRRSDAVFMLKTWKKSVGAKREREEALELEIPVFSRFEYLQKWLEMSGESARFSCKPPVWVNVPGGSLIVGMSCSKNKQAQDYTTGDLLDPNGSYDVQIVRWMKRGLWSPAASRDE